MPWKVKHSKQAIGDTLFMIGAGCIFLVLATGTALVIINIFFPYIMGG